MSIASELAAGRTKLRLQDYHDFNHSADKLSTSWTKALSFETWNFADGSSVTVQAKDWSVSFSEETSKADTLTIDEARNAYADALDRYTTAVSLARMHPTPSNIVKVQNLAACVYDAEENLLKAKQEANV